MQFERDTVIQTVEGTLTGGLAASRPVSLLAWDSRAVVPGALFVALPGQNVDGHDFVGQAVQQGAAGVLSTRTPDAQLAGLLDRQGVWLVTVDDCLAALARLAKRWRAVLGGRVVALTGSSGKTTTKNLIRDCLAAHGTVTATQANQNNELGVPATILSADADCDYVVVEMGMRGSGQIAQLCDMAQPDIALVTNVGTSHIELLGSREGIARAKSEVYASLGADGTALLNVADPYCRLMREHAGLDERQVRMLGFDGSGLAAAGAQGDDALQACVFARDISLDRQGHPEFALCTTLAGQLQSVPCRLALRGAHNVANAVAAAAVGLCCGMGLAEAAAALAASQPEQGRFDARRAASGLCVIDDSYNANPDSMRAALESFMAMEVPGRRVAVLGDMGELGPYAPEGHALVGSLAAQCGLDALVCTGTLARGMAQAALDAGMDAQLVRYAQDAAEALDVLAGMQPALSEGDCVLVKASHAMGLQAVAEGLVG